MTEHVLLAAVWPFVVGALVAALAARRTPGRWAGAVLLVAAYLPIHAYHLGLPLPGEASEVVSTRAEAWLGWLVLLAGLAGLALPSERRALALAQRSALLAAILIAVTSPLLLRGGWDTPLERAAWLAGLGVPLALMTAGAERSGREESPALAFALVAVSALAGALVVGLGGAAMYSQLAAAVAAGAGGAAVVGLLLARSGQRPPLAASAGPVVAAALGGVMVAGVLYAQGVAKDAALLAVLPLVLHPWLARTHFGARLAAQRTIRADLVRLVLLSIPALVAIALAIVRFEPDPYGY